MRNEADKVAKEIRRKMLRALHVNRISLDAAKRKLDQLHQERRQLIEEAWKIMTLEEIGEALRLSKQRVSKILESRLKERRRNGEQQSSSRGD